MDGAGDVYPFWDRFDDSISTGVTPSSAFATIRALSNYRWDHPGLGNPYQADLAAPRNKTQKKLIVGFGFKVEQSSNELQLFVYNQRPVFQTIYDSQRKIMNLKLTVKLIGIFLLLLFVLAACGGSSIQEQIIGQWEIANEELGLSMVFNFLEDGFMVITIADLEIDGTYEWLGDDVIKITMEQNGQNNEILGPVQIEGDHLMISNDRGDTETFTRVE